MMTRGAAHARFPVISRLTMARARPGPRDGRGQRTMGVAELPAMATLAAMAAIETRSAA